MKKIGTSALKAILALASIALIFAAVWLLIQGGSYVMGAITLYWNFAKNHVVESIIFYVILTVCFIVIDIAINIMVKHLKHKKD